MKGLLCSHYSHQKNRLYYYSHFIKGEIGAYRDKWLFLKVTQVIKHWDLKFLQWQIHFLFIRHLYGTPLYTLAQWCASYLFFSPSFFHIHTILGIIWLMKSPLWSSQPTPSTSPPHNLMISYLGIENFASYSSGGGGWGGATVSTERKEKMLSLYAIITCIHPVFPLNPHLLFSTFSADKAVLHYNRYTSYPLSTILTMPKTKQIWSLDHKNICMETTINGWMVKKMWSMDRMEFYSIIKNMKS